MGDFKPRLRAAGASLAISPNADEEPWQTSRWSLDDTDIAAVGSLIEPDHAGHILQTGQADIIALGRQLMAEPHWGYRAALALGHPDPSSVLPEPYGFYMRRRENALLPSPANTFEPAGQSMRGEQKWMRRG